MNTDYRGVVSRKEVYTWSDLDGESIKPCSVHGGWVGGTFGSIRETIDDLSDFFGYTPAKDDARTFGLNMERMEDSSGEPCDDGEYSCHYTIYIQKVSELSLEDLDPYL